MPDRRTVHAEGKHIEVVRYDRAGKWYIESKSGQYRREHVPIKHAVTVARNLRSSGGTVHLGRHGGSTFDRLVTADIGGPT